MDFGVVLFSHPDSWKAVRRAEELGFSHAWFYDSQMIATDVIVAMTLAAEHTERIRLGTGVLVPTNRIAPVAACCLASLNQLAPGRVVCGIGTGFTARNTMGLGPQPLARLRAYVQVVQRLLRGETVPWRAEGAERLVRFLHPDGGFVNLRDPIPFHVSAFGPRGRALVAEMADGWITFSGRVSRAADESAAVAAACRDAGRDPAGLHRSVFTLGCVLAEGEQVDSPRAVAQAGPLAATNWHSLMERLDRGGAAPEPGSRAAEYRRLYEGYGREAPYLRLHTGHLLFVRDDERPFISADDLRANTFTATAAELRDRARALAAAGFTQLAVQIVPGHEDALEDWARVFETV